MARKAATGTARKTPKGASAVKPPPGIAFFDFDNTLIHGDAGPLFGRSLFSAQLHERRFWGRVRLRLRYAPYINWMALQAALYGLRLRKRSKIVRAAYTGLKGIAAKEFDDRIDTFVDKEIPSRVYPEVRRHVEGHFAAGRRCVVITTGMEPLVKRALRHFPAGMEVIGCRLLARDGKLTGRVVGPLFGVDKANILDAYCRALGVEPKDCYAYSDHWSDKEMLEAVGHGVAINPQPRLRRRALQVGWEVLDVPDPSAARADSRSLRKRT